MPLVGKKTSMWSVASRVIIYALAITAPVIASAFQRPSDIDPFPVELATRFALLGLSILLMQFVVSARIKWAERPFGLDEIFRFHKAMAVFATLLLIGHPLLLATGEDGWKLFTGHQPWVVQIGKVTLGLLIVLVIISFFRTAIRFEFQKWRITHDIVAGLVFIIGFIHGFKQSGDLERDAARALLSALLLAAAIAYTYHMLIIPILARRRSYKVTAVRQETHDVWTIEAAPAQGGQVFDYKPGQFGFLTLYRQFSPHSEEHPFTISSSPAARDNLTFTIKESGDYTSTIGSTKPGDSAAIQGAFGRFSYAFHPGERDIVFIAGGIGITPLISMLRYMRDTNADVDAQLIWFNKTEKDIAFREELTGMQSKGRLRLKITHILSKPDKSWRGETGYADRDKLARLIGENITAKSYYVCGPAPMMSIVTKALLGLNVPASKIYYERFAL